MLGRFGRRDDVVPLEVARRIHAEREAALELLERSRQDTAQLRRALEQREEEHRVLVRNARVLEAEAARARTLEAEVARARAAEAELARTARALETELARARAAEADLARTTRTLEAELARTRVHDAEMTRARAECDDLRSRLDHAQATLDAHEQAHGEAQARLDEVHRSEPDGGRVQELLADLANLRRRRDIDLAAGQRAEQVRLLGRLADVRDSVMWGLAAAPDKSSAWYAGLTSIRDQVDAQLHAEGATLFGHAGERFDPQVHEAVAAVHAPGVASGAVARVESPGVKLEDGTLVRPARVSVAT